MTSPSLGLKPERGAPTASGRPPYLFRFLLADFPAFNLFRFLLAHLSFFFGYFFFIFSGRPSESVPWARDAQQCAVSSQHPCPLGHVLMPKILLILKLFTQQRAVSVPQHPRPLGHVLMPLRWIKILKLFTQQRAVSVSQHPHPLGQGRALTPKPW